MKVGKAWKSKLKMIKGPKIKQNKAKLDNVKQTTKTRQSYHVMPWKCIAQLIHGTFPTSFPYWLEAIVPYLVGKVRDYFIHFERELQNR